MKNFVFVALLGLSSSLTFAADLKPSKSLRALRINSVSTEIVGRGATHVTAQATFSNSCGVPRSEELFQVTQQLENGAVLSITLASDVRRMCTADYNPVTVTIDLGMHVRPDDGSFSNVTVNGVNAD